MNDRPTTAIPDIGPADLAYPRRALARLAFSSSAQELSDSAAELVPTTADEYGSAFDDVDSARRLLSGAQHAFERAVVHAYERSRDWDEIGAALDLTGEEAKARYGHLIAEWEDALDRPWDDSREIRSSRLPDGLSDPEGHIRYLDRWCSRRVDSAARASAEVGGTADRMVSAGLPEHTALTESSREWRIAERLLNEGVSREDPRWVAHRERRSVRDAAKAGS